MRRQVAPSNVALTAGLLLTLLAACLLLTASPAYAKTFTVNTKADSADQKPGDGKCFTGQSFALIGPECTLRAAMVEANKFPGADTIGFNIGLFGTGLQTIEVGKTGNGALPTITKAVTIDGYTEGGATKNTIPLAKDGTNAVLEIELDGPTRGARTGWR
jgi:CSLREA domain-containing protein